MNPRFNFLTMVPTFILGLVGNLGAAEEVSTAAPIPEPSIAVLGALCGIFFLLWRKK